jgi:hypothetical protein
MPIARLSRLRSISPTPNLIVLTCAAPDVLAPGVLPRRTAAR